MAGRTMVLYKLMHCSIHLPKPCPKLSSLLTLGPVCRVYTATQQHWSMSSLCLAWQSTRVHGPAQGARCRLPSSSKPVAPCQRWPFEPASLSAVARATSTRVRTCLRPQHWREALFGTKLITSPNVCNEIACRIPLQALGPPSPPPFHLLIYLRITVQQHDHDDLLLRLTTAASAQKNRKRVAASLEASRGRKVHISCFGAFAGPRHTQSATSPKLRSIPKITVRNPV